MPYATVTVRYVNDPKPGKKMGSIKSTDDVYYGAWPNQLRQFESGQTYDIEYEELGSGFKKFVRFQDEGQRQEPTKANGARRPGSGDQTEDNACMGLVNRAFHGTGVIPPVDELTNMFTNIRLAWRASKTRADNPTAEMAQEAAHTDDPNDAVPF